MLLRRKRRQARAQARLSDGSEWVPAAGPEDGGWKAKYAADIDSAEGGGGRGGQKGIQAARGDSITGDGASSLAAAPPADGMGQLAALWAQAILPQSKPG